MFARIDPAVQHHGRGEWGGHSSIFTLGRDWDGLGVQRRLQGVPGARSGYRCCLAASKLHTKRYFTALSLPGICSQDMADCCCSLFRRAFWIAWNAESPGSCC